MNDTWTKVSRYFLGMVLWLFALSALGIIDFHVCIKDAGHCQIIDPTQERR